MSYTLAAILERIDHHAVLYASLVEVRHVPTFNDKKCALDKHRAEIGKMIVGLRASRAKLSNSRRGWKPGQKHPGVFHICPECKARGCYLPLCVSCRIKARRRNPEEVCRRFNSLYPIGSKVSLLKDGDRRVDTTTRSEAYVCNAGYPVIFLVGVTGYYLLDRVTPL